MERMTLGWFLNGKPDLESQQYKVLQGLKEQYHEFSHNRLYPALSDLIALAGALEGLMQKRDGLEGRLPRTLRDVDLQTRKLLFEPESGSSPEIERIWELASWALPLIHRAIEEGMAIYNFVESHIAIEEVGILPAYREEGYWFMPDPAAALLHLLRYEMSLFSSSSERYRALKTVLIESIEQHQIIHSPESVKLSLVQKYRDMPNPATYRCEVDMTFPFAETVMPIAKRKLMARLAA